MSAPPESSAPLRSGTLPMQGRADCIVILASYLLLSAVPFVPYLFGKAAQDPGWMAGIEVAAWCAAWAVCKRPRRVHWLLLPAFVLLPADVYLYLFYGRGVSARHLGMVLDTSPREMAEFLGGSLWSIAAVTLVFIAWWWLVRRSTLRTDRLDWTGASRGFALAAVSILAVAWASGHGPPAWMQVAAARVDLADTRPFGLFVTAAEYWSERRQLAAMGIGNRAFVFGAHQAHPDTTTLTIVFVIGESSRYDRWSLNGYARDTNPLLAKEANLISAPDVVASASATLLSLPVMLSRKQAMQTYRTGFPEKSFISAFRESGFRTYWISNQIPFGEFDTPVSVFAREADVIQFMNPGGYSDISSLDGILLQPLRNALEDPAPKKLIVLHSLGNHWNYSLRYPEAFDRWRPSLAGVPDPDHTDAGLKGRIDNSYDNSVLYTDWFLARVIAALKSPRNASAMIYISDHGENLHDGACDFVLHGHNTLYDYHVPMLAWYSDAYAAKFPGKVTQLRSHATAPLSTENIFHSILDMADIRYAGERLAWSILSSDFRPHKRYVDSYGWADYDNSTFDGECREVIDKGVPLPRTAGKM